MNNSTNSTSSYGPEWNYRFNQQRDTETTPYSFALLLMTIFVLAVCFGIPVFFTFCKKKSDQQQVQSSSQPANDAEHDAAETEKQERIEAHLSKYFVILQPSHFVKPSGRMVDTVVDETLVAATDKETLPDVEMGDVENNANLGETHHDTTNAIPSQTDDTSSSCVVEEPLYMAAVVGEDDDDQLQLDSSHHLTMLSFNNTDNRQVASSCAICLTSYEVGEALVWSPNCTHAFHHECIQTWFQRKTSELQCPFCRQCYVEESNDDDKEVEVVETAQTNESNDDDDDPL